MVVKFSPAEADDATDRDDEGGGVKAWMSLIMPDADDSSPSSLWILFLVLLLLTLPVDL